MIGYSEDTNLRTRHWTDGHNRKLGGTDGGQEARRGRKSNHPSGARRAKNNIKLMFANVTVLDKKAINRLANDHDHHVIGIAETHKRGDGIQSIMRDFDLAGWNPQAANAEHVMPMISGLMQIYVKTELLALQQPEWT